MLITLCALLIALVEIAVLFVPGAFAYEGIFHIITLCLALFVIGELIIRYRHTMQRTSGKLEREKLENERLQAQLNQVLIERKNLDAKTRELEKALEHEKAQSARSSMSSSPRDEALTLLSLLQAKGRFVDFVMEDIAAYDDAQVAAAARYVHQGCKSVLQEHAAIVPLENKKEGDECIVDVGTNPLRVRVIGKCNGGSAKGVLLHRGWKTAYLKLPQRILSVEEGPPELVISPAEIEVR